MTPDRHPMRWARCACGIVTTCVWSVAREQYLYARHNVPRPADAPKWQPGTRCALALTAVAGETYAAQAEVPLSTETC